MNIKLKKERIKEIKIGDENYPEKLLHIYKPPKILYVIGNEKLLNKKAIAIVGCRACSEYGKNIAYNFSKELTKKNINIISGLARGIDTYAHKGNVDVFKKNTLNENLKSSLGKTIAVLGTGLDEIYPKENLELYKEIIRSGGAIITEYPLGTKPKKWQFPARNRIISGLSDGVLVVEAKKRSGTIITVEHALEQGKDIYSVPRKYIK